MHITSGDIVFYKNVDRSTPERLLPLMTTLPSGEKSLLPGDIQYFMDIAHIDNEEGVLYMVLFVYRTSGAAMVIKPEEP